MDTVPFVWPVVSEILILLLVVVGTGLPIAIHRKRLLESLVAKQNELIARLRADSSTEGAVNDRAFYHLKDTAKWIQTRYRHDYGAETRLPARVTGEKDQQQVEMLVALQTLGREIQAYREELDPEQSWAEIQPRLKQVLKPLYHPDDDGIPVVADAAPGAENTVERDEHQQAFEDAKARAAAAEEALGNAEAAHQALLDEIAERLAGPDGSETLNEWFASRHGGGAATSSHDDQAGDDIMRKALADSLQKSEAEMKNLRNALAGQHETVARLKYKLSQEGGAEAIDSADLESLNRMLQESDTCIKTLEMDLEETHAHAQSLEQQVTELEKRLAASAASRPTKELEDTIKTLEDAAAESANQIAALRQELAEQKNVNAELRERAGISEEPAESPDEEERVGERETGEPAESPIDEERVGEPETGEQQA